MARLEREIVRRTIPVLYLEVGRNRSTLLRLQFPIWNCSVKAGEATKADQKFLIKNFLKDVEMNKTILLAAMVAIGLAACGKAEAPKTEAPKAAAPAPAAAAPAPAPAPAAPADAAAAPAAAAPAAPAAAAPAAAAPAAAAKPAEAPKK